MKMLSMAFTLFLLMDSIGNVPLFVTILKQYTPREQKKIIFRELLIALGIIFLFALIGEIFLNFLAVQQYTIQIAGGIILFLIALKMIFPQSVNGDHQEETEDPFIVPLATPLVAGPATIATVMLYSHDHFLLTTFGAIIIAWVFSLVILLASTKLKKILGKKGLTACERLMGLVLILLAVQMFLHGLSCYIEPACKAL